MQPCVVARNGTEISGHVTVLSLANNMLLHLHIALLASLTYL